MGTKDQIRRWTKNYAEKKKIYDYELGGTPKGVLTTIYFSQVKTSKKRGHQPPAYTKQELIERFINDPTFLELHAAWLSGGRKKMEKPSLDRIDDSKGYSFSNIQWMTWKANKSKHVAERGTPLDIYKDGQLVGHYSSCRVAIKEVGVYFRAGDVEKINRGKPLMRKGYEIRLSGGAR